MKNSQIKTTILFFLICFFGFITGWLSWGGTRELAEAFHDHGQPISQQGELGAYEYIHHHDGLGLPKSYQDSTIFTVAKVVSQIILIILIYLFMNIITRKKE